MDSSMSNNNLITSAQEYDLLDITSHPEHVSNAIEVPVKKYSIAIPPFSYIRSATTYHLRKKIPAFRLEFFYPSRHSFLPSGIRRHLLFINISIPDFYPL
ncbi:hypothetical protein ABKN59_006554 [Abortiporus biennis]